MGRAASGLVYFRRKFVKVNAAGLFWHFINSIWQEVERDQISVLGRVKMAADDVAVSGVAEQENISPSV